MIIIQTGICLQVPVFLMLFRGIPSERIKAGDKRKPIIGDHENNPCQQQSQQEIIETCIAAGGKVIAE
mgnify:CR=1 FL=1